VTAAQLGALLVGLAAALASLGWLLARAWHGMRLAVHAVEVITGRPPVDPDDPDDRGVPGLAARLHQLDRDLEALRVELTTRNSGSTVRDQLHRIERKADHAHQAARDAIGQVAQTADHAAQQRAVIVEAVDALAFALAEHARASCGQPLDDYPPDQPLPKEPRRE
jgi:TolA-binding protein